MKKLKHFLLFSAIAASLVVMISCSKNPDPKNSKNDDSKRQVMSEQNGIEKDILSSGPAYIMRLEEKNLSLYEISDGEESVISTIVIDPSYYPAEDIKELKAGVVAYSKEDGYLRLENFTN